jgi:hypothetical protein
LPPRDSQTSTSIRAAPLMRCALLLWGRRRDLRHGRSRSPSPVVRSSSAVSFPPSTSLHQLHAVVGRRSLQALLRLLYQQKKPDSRHHLASGMIIFILFP